MSILVFLFILLFILLVIIIITSKIQIKIINFNFASDRQKHINSDYLLSIKIYILKKIPIFKLTFNENKIRKKLNNIKVQEKIKNVEREIILNKNRIDLEVIKLWRNLNLKIKELELNIEIGTESAFLTSLLVPIISTCLAIALRINDEDIKDKKYIVKPIFRNQNFIKILISGIFEIKMIHIMNIIYILKKKEGVNKNERTSNRRSYDYSYE